MNYKQRFKHALLPVLLPVISYGILGPLEIYFGNASEFRFGLGDFVLPLLGAAVLAWLLGSAVLALVPGRAFRPASALVLGFGVASYAQNMFFNTKLSEADGSAMRWDTLGTYPAVNAAVWLVILAAAVALSLLLKKQWNTLCMAIPAFLCAIQLVAVVSLAFTPHPSVSSEKQVSGENQFKVASQQNIIVFVLDTVSNEHLEPAEWLYPDLLEGLQDFTRYTNADCCYYTTFPSMSHMLTGVPFDFSASSWEQWLEDAWHSGRTNDFYSQMHAAGYACELYSPDLYNYGTAENLAGHFDNVQNVPRTVQTGRLLGLLEKLSAYRYLPYVCKPGFEVLSTEFADVVEYPETKVSIESNTDFYAALKEQGLTVNQSVKKEFMVQHLFGVHGPYTTAPDGTYIAEAGPDQAVKGCFTIVKDYMERLKELGLYDSSTIIITADHGHAQYAGLQPIYFIKQAGEHHDEMQLNTAPISHDDFQATMLTLAGAESGEEFGTSIFDWQPGQTRTRTLYVREKDDRYPTLRGNDAFNVFYEYTYTTDGAELAAKYAQGPDAILQAPARY